MNKETFDKADAIDRQLSEINSQLEKLEAMTKYDEWTYVQIMADAHTLYIPRHAYEGIFANIKKNLLARHTALVAEFESL